MNRSSRWTASHLTVVRTVLRPVQFGKNPFDVADEPNQPQPPSMGFAVEGLLDLQLPAGGAGRHRLLAGDQDGSGPEGRLVWGVLQVGGGRGGGALSGCF